MRFFIFAWNIDEILKQAEGESSGVDSEIKFWRSTLILTLTLVVTSLTLFHSPEFSQSTQLPMLLTFIMILIAVSYYRIQFLCIKKLHLNLSIQTWHLIKNGSSVNDIHHLLDTSSKGEESLDWGHFALFVFGFSFLIYLNKIVNSFQTSGQSFIFPILLIIIGQIWLAVSRYKFSYAIYNLTKVLLKHRKNSWRVRHDELQKSLDYQVQVIKDSTNEGQYLQSISTLNRDLMRATISQYRRSIIGALQSTWTSRLRKFKVKKFKNS